MRLISSVLTLTAIVVASTGVVGVAHADRFCKGLSNAACDKQAADAVKSFGAPQGAHPTFVGNGALNRPPYPGCVSKGVDGDATKGSQKWSCPDKAINGNGR